MSETFSEGPSDDGSNIGDVARHIQEAADSLPDEALSASLGALDDAIRLLGTVGTDSSLLLEGKQSLGAARERLVDILQKMNAGREELRLYVAAIGCGETEAHEQDTVISPLDDPNAELPPPTAAEVYAKCMDDLGAAIMSAMRRKQAGENIITGAITSGLCDLVAYETERGNIAQAEEYFAMIKDYHYSEKYLNGVLMGDLDYSSYAEACFTLGTERAFDSLRRELESRKDQNDSELLQRVVGICADRGLPPDRWIDQYAPNAEIHTIMWWTYYLPKFPSIYLKPYKPLLPREGPQPRMAEMVDDLVHDHSVASGWARRHIIAVISYVQDPSLRVRLLSRYLSDVSTAILEKDELVEHAEFATEVLKDSALATPQVVAHFDKSIAEGAATVISDETIVETSKATMGWHMALAIHRGATHTEVIESTGRVATNLLNTLGQDEHASRQADNILSVMSNLFYDHALRYAENKDFSAAATYVAAIPRENRQVTARARCLRYADKAEDVACMKPADEVVMLDEQLAYQLDTTQTMVSGNLDDIETKLISVVESGMDSHYNGEFYLPQGLRRMQRLDPDRYVRFCRTLVEGYRRKNYYISIEIMTKLLLEAGASDEAHNTYMHVIAPEAKRDAVSRIQDVASLASMLRKHLRNFQ